MYFAASPESQLNLHMLDVADIERREGIHSDFFRRNPHPQDFQEPCGRLQRIFFTMNKTEIILRHAGQCMLC